MCGRFTLWTAIHRLVEQFQLSTSLQLPLRYNIAPTQDVATVRILSETVERQLSLLRWGLVPSWSKDLSIGTRMINARSETIATKPAFRAAFKRRRCLVLADGYYEWQKVGRQKQPYYFHMRDDRPFALAGLWELWRNEDAHSDAAPLETCTIITTESNEVARRIHDRMPVILDPEHYELWLDPDFDRREALESILVPCPSDEMVAQPVSTHVNRPANDDPKCIEAQSTPS